uniref:Cytochrome P450 n=1 Tax=Tanacetum cinerariifolium TaxID=118510 RepID=A0A6L2KCG0_TANCI|nr:cytochrome P450 [Tanacetum cinerariifolium]
MFIEFMIQNQFFSYSLEEFAKILDIPCEGACVFTDKWSLDELAYSVLTDGPYQTNPPSPDDIISSIRIDREGQVHRIHHEEEIDVLEYQVLTHEIKPTLKLLEEIIRKILERIVAREEVITPLLLIPPLTNHPLLISMMMMEMAKGPRVQALLHLFPSFSFFLPSSYSSNNSTKNSTKAFSSNPFKKIKLTIILYRQLFSNISSDEDVITTPSPTTTSSSLTPPNTPSKTTSTNQTSSRQETTSSSFQSKLQILPPSSNEPTSPHSLNPFLENILDVSPRPLNPQPLQIILL